MENELSAYDRLRERADGSDAIALVLSWALGGITERSGSIEDDCAQLEPHVATLDSQATRIREMEGALQSLVLQVDAAKWPSPYNAALVDALGYARRVLGEGRVRE